MTEETVIVTSLSFDANPDALVVLDGTGSVHGMVICSYVLPGFDGYSCEYSVLVIGCTCSGGCTLGTVVAARAEAVARLLVLVARQKN